MKTKLKNKNFEIKNGKGWEGQEVAKGTKIIASLSRKRQKLFSDNLGNIQKKVRKQQQQCIVAVISENVWG
jgi:hypothetical protein